VLRVVHGSRNVQRLLHREGIEKDSELGQAH
jgi:hypothetical protein